MSIECLRCRQANPDGQRYCGNCGAALAAPDSNIREYIDEYCRRELRDIVKADYKDQKLVEIETAEAIVNRVTSWTKLAAFFIGAPIAILVFVLGFFGVKSFTDFTAEMQSVHADVSAKLALAQQDAAKIREDGKRLNRDYEILQVNLLDTKDVAAKIKLLTTQYEELAAGLSKTQALAAQVNALDKKIVNIGDSVKAALVLGNSKIDGKTTLPNALNDVDGVSNALTQIGFRVTRGVDLTKSALEKQIDSFKATIVPGDTVFIYYAGHGIAVNGKNYLVPIDFDRTLDEDRAVGMIVPIETLVDDLKSSNPRAIIFALDACRNNPFPTRAIGGLIRPKATPEPGIFMIYSTSDGSLAFDDVEASPEHSPFAFALMSELVRKDRNIAEVAAAVRASVVAMTKGEQKPAYFDDSIEPIYLAGRTQ